MEDLDDLLDSALDDFQNFEISKPEAKAATKGVAAKELSALRDSEGSGPSVSDGSSREKLGQGLGLGLPALSPGKKKATVSKFGSSSGAASSGRLKESSDIHSNLTPQRPLSATLDMLAQQTRETVSNIDVVDKDDLIGEEMVENLMKQFEDLGASQDMQSIMDTMMRQLLSKEVLHEPMKEIGERYPEWLAANKSKLSQEDYARYTKQHQFIMQLCDVYDSTPDDFPKVMELMQSMQNCGQPPKDIVRELAPGLDLDEDGLPMLPDFGALGAGGQPNCSIM